MTLYKHASSYDVRQLTAYVIPLPLFYAFSTSIPQKVGHYYYYDLGPVNY